MLPQPPLFTRHHVHIVDAGFFICLLRQEESSTSSITFRAGSGGGTEQYSWIFLRRSSRRGCGHTAVSEEAVAINECCSPSPDVKGSFAGEPCQAPSFGEALPPHAAPTHPTWDRSHLPPCRVLARLRPWAPSCCGEGMLPRAACPKSHLPSAAPCARPQIDGGGYGVCPEHPGRIVASGRDAQQRDGEKPSRYWL